MSDAHPSVTPAPAKRSLYHRFRQGPSGWKLVRGYWPWLFLVALVLALGWMLVKPAPPSRVIIATGTPSGSYQWFAKKYAAIMAQSGVTLEIRESAGSVQNYTMLNEAAAAAASAGPKWTDDGVSVAIVQSGTCPEGIKADIKAVASLYLEPIWIFYRGPSGWQLPDLRNRRIAVGPDGSGTRSLATKLLDVNGIRYERASGAATKPASAINRALAGAWPATQPTTGPWASPVYLTPLSERTAAAALRAGQLDAAAFVCSPRHPLIKELLSDPAIRLMSFERHEAYSRNFAFLSDVKLPRGAVDLAHDLPGEDTYLLAPAANLVCREGTHPAIVALLIKAATIAHERGDLLSAPGKMPSTQYVEFPVDPAAAEYFRSGPPLLQRLLPFSIAAFVDRMKILVLPLLTLIIPIARLAPPVYVWRIRSRIYRWYGVLRAIDRRLRDTAVENQRFESDLATLKEMDQELAQQEVPLSYMEEFYNLRLHTDFLLKRVEQRIGGVSSSAVTPAIPPATAQ